MGRGRRELHFFPLLFLRLFDCFSFFLKKNTEIKKIENQSIKILSMMKNCPLLFERTGERCNLTLPLFDQMNLPYGDEFLFYFYFFFGTAINIFRAQEFLFFFSAKELKFFYGGFESKEHNFFWSATMIFLYLIFFF